MTFFRDFFSCDFFPTFVKPPRRFNRVPTIYVLSKNIKIFVMKCSFFFSTKNLCLLHGHVFVMPKFDVRLTSIQSTVTDGIYYFV